MYKCNKSDECKQTFCSHGKPHEKMTLCGFRCSKNGSTVCEPIYSHDINDIFKELLNSITEKTYELKEGKKW